MVDWGHYEKFNKALVIVIVCLILYVVCGLLLIHKQVGECRSEGGLNIASNYHEPSSIYKCGFPGEDYAGDGVVLGCDYGWIDWTCVRLNDNATVSGAPLRKVMGELYEKRLG